MGETTQEKELNVLIKEAKLRIDIEGLITCIIRLDTNPDFEQRHDVAAEALEIFMERRGLKIRNRDNIFHFSSYYVLAATTPDGIIPRFLDFTGDLSLVTILREMLEHEKSKSVAEA